ADPQSALIACIQQHGLMVKRTAWRITGNEHLAEDVCQVVFLVLVRKMKQLTRVQALGGWLHRVAVLAARDAIKAEARRKRREERVAMLYQASGQTAKELPTGLDEAIDRLPEKYRQVIVAHYLEGRKHVQIADDLGIPEETVKKRGSLGLQRLRQVLAPSTTGLSVAALTSALSAEAGAAPLAASQVAAIQAAATGTAATVQVTAMADLAVKAMLWAKMKLYALVMASVAVVAVPTYLALKPTSEPGGLVGH